MEKSRGNSKIIKNHPKAKPSSSSSSSIENISPMKLEIEDPIFSIGRGRFHNSMMPLSPTTFLSYAENLDINSPLTRYLRGGGGGSPISGRLSSSGESFTSPITNSRKNRSPIVQLYSSSGSSGSSGGSGMRNRLSISSSPLSSIENLEMMTSPVYGTPVKAEEEGTLVMDAIQVRLSSSSSSGGGKRLVTDIGKKVGSRHLIK